MTSPDYEVNIQAAETELKSAQTADDIRRVWRKYSPTLGHRALGRLLVGRPSSELIARRETRANDRE